MRHRGTLFAPDNSDGIIAVFVLDEDRFSLEVGGEEWAGWHVSLITLSEIGVNEYEFNLNGDTVRFIPDSRLDFAYGAVPGLAKAQEAASKGFRARRKTRKATQKSAKTSGRIPVAAAPSPPPTPAAAERPTSVKPPKVAKPKVAKVAKPKVAKADKPVAKKPVANQPAANRPVVSKLEQAPPTEPTPPEAAPKTTRVAPAASSAPTPSVAAHVPAHEAAPERPSVASGDPFTEPALAGATATPATPVNGELVIDLRAADDAKKLATPPESRPPAGNGHHPAHAAKAESKGGLRILERVRQSRAEHVHDYEVSSSGVMVRRVCSTCNHVSIGTSD